MLPTCYQNIESAIELLHNPSIQKQANLVLKMLGQEIAQHDTQDDMPELRGAEAPDGSFLIECLFPNRRVGFNIEVNPAESGWYYVAITDAGPECDSGLLT